MTKERALKEAQILANKKRLVMAVACDSIVNNAEEEPDGPWGYCPSCARIREGCQAGNLILFPWATEIIILNPA
jgi:hypothetical protein